MSLETFADGGYRYIPAVSQYSGGVVPEHGSRIERVVLSRVLPLAEGFEFIDSHLKQLGRPATAFCACELRSPAQFTEQGFRDFNASRDSTRSLTPYRIPMPHPASLSQVAPNARKVLVTIATT